MFLLWPLAIWLFLAIPDVAGIGKAGLTYMFLVPQASGLDSEIRGSSYLPAPGCFTEDRAGLRMCGEKGPNLYVSGDADLVKVRRELTSQWSSVETACCSGKLGFIDENIILQDAKHPHYFSDFTDTLPL